MKFSKCLMVQSLFAATVFSMLLTSNLFLHNQALAACVGTVHSLGAVVDPDRGKGVLSVRSGPSTSNRQITILLNGEQASVLDRKGSWFFVSTIYNVRGWVHSRYFSVSC